MKFLDKPLKQMNPQERALLRSYGLMRELANYAELDGKLSMAKAYRTSAELLACGVDCDWENLNGKEWGS